MAQIKNLTIKMNLKNIFIGIAILVVVVVGFFEIETLIKLSKAIDENQQVVGGVDSFNKFGSAATSSVISVGPQENVRVRATSSRRAYLYMGSTQRINPIYCRMDQDKTALVGEGIEISTSTNNVYEITTRNLYYGSIRCTATASTTLSIHEYLAQ